jgi:predicted dehydrogenase
MDKVRLGLIGTSWWADFMYVPSIKSHAGAELAAVCGTDAERTSAFAAKHGIARSHVDWREMLAAGGLDGVIVSVPDDLHKEITLGAINAGLHVLCEKPLALNAADAADMLAAAEARGVYHLVLYTWREQPIFRYLKQLVDQGYVGRPLRASFGFVASWSYAEVYQWRQDGVRANGVLGDLGSHVIDMALWLLGPMTSVSAHAPRLIDRSGFGGRTPSATNDTAHLTVEFANGAQGLIDVSGLVRLGSSEPHITARIDGDEGSLDVHYEPLGPNRVQRIFAQRHGETERVALTIPEDMIPPLDRGEPSAPFTQQSAGARRFIDAILGGFRPEPGFEAGVAVQRVIDAALRSYAERRWVDVG